MSVIGKNKNIKTKELNSIMPEQNLHTVLRNLNCSGLYSNLSPLNFRMWLPAFVSDRPDAATDLFLAHFLLNQDQLIGNFPLPVFYASPLQGHHTQHNDLGYHPKQLLLRQAQFALQYSRHELYLPLRK